MNRWHIYNGKTGICLGVYRGESLSDALWDLAEDAGCDASELSDHLVCEKNTNLNCECSND